LFTTEDACGRPVVIPMTTPESMVTVGPDGGNDDSATANPAGPKASDRKSDLFLMLDEELNSNPKRQLGVGTPTRNGGAEADRRAKLIYTSLMPLQSRVVGVILSAKTKSYAERYDNPASWS